MCEWFSVRHAGKRFPKGLPLELLQAVQALDQAQNELLRTTADYSEAQFRLYRALGWPER